MPWTSLLASLDFDSLDYLIQEQGQPLPKLTPPTLRIRLGPLSFQAGSSHSMLRTIQFPFLCLFPSLKENFFLPSSSTGSATFGRD